MPGKLINHTLTSISSGVTQQYEEGRFESQVSSMVNCLPTITRGIIRRNPLVSIGKLSTVTSSSFVYSYDRGTGTEQYIVVIPGDGTLHTYNANSGTLLYSKTGSAYLTVGIGIRAKDSFKALTIGDYTFILNTTITTAFTTKVSTSVGYKDMAFYWIKKTASIVTEQYQTAAPIQTGSYMRGYQYKLNGFTIDAYEETRPTFTKVNLNTSSTIAAKFITVPTSSLATKVVGSVCYNDNFTGTDWKWEDSFGNEASLGVWDSVDSSDKLPVNLPSDLEGFIVKISGGTSAEYDDYFLTYDYAGRTWTETTAPDSLIELDATTMPHVLYRLSTGFIFNTYQGVSTDGTSLDGISEWGERVAGGQDDTNDPSFLGNKIINIIFHKNRLGFLTSDSVLLSQTGAYGNFFIQTMQDTLDDDPIDLAVASTDVTVLRHAVPTAGQLILFADDTQFALSSADAILTPNSADIIPLSNYTYGKGADARAIGNRVYFSNQAGGYSQMYSYKVTDQGSSLTEADPLTIHVPSYIDKSIKRIIGHDVLGYVFMEVEDYPKELVVLSTIIKGTEILQNAFHKWTFNKDIVSTHIINNSLYILFSDGSLTNMLLEIPGNIDTVNYTDNYNTIDNNIYYESKIGFSKFFYRGKDGKGTERGRLQLRTMLYTTTATSKFKTDILNNEMSLYNEDTMFGPIWDDTLVWDDTKIWIDVNPLYTRTYKNDKKVTIMADSKKADIFFSSNEDYPTKGFELATVNVESYFHQRSTRT